MPTCSSASSDISFASNKDVWTNWSIVIASWMKAKAVSLPAPSSRWPTANSDRSEDARREFEPLASRISELPVNHEMARTHQT